jgi:histidyl-tRNA synthetase
MKPSIPKGTRDFGAQEVRKRQYIINTIKTEFERFGYQPLETPVMENMTTLTGKYGDEGEKLLFRILNSGNFMDGINSDIATSGTSKLLQPYIAEKGLRYDLTIPFARYVVMNQGKLTFPFRRYQIQPVWRADRPQRGRYREFYQCDADVIGSTSLLNEVELTQIYDRVFAQLKIPVTIHLNNRKILAGMAEVAQQPELLTDITIAIDKLDKIGMDGVCKELAERGVTEQAQAIIADFLSIDSNEPQAVLEQLRTRLASSEIGMLGIAEMQTLINYLATLNQAGQGLSNPIKIDITLARGLNYYTGTIYEVKTNAVQMGSLGGGGRYDDLTGAFGLKGMSGVGISFGLDRVYDVLEELGLNNWGNSSTTRVLFINFGNNAEQYAFETVTQLRSKGINAEIYPDNAKLDKQMKYANALQIPFVAFTGDEEMATQQVKIKNMTSGEQQTVNIAQLIAIIS